MLKVSQLLCSVQIIDIGNKLRAHYSCFDVNWFMFHCIALHYIWLLIVLDWSLFDSMFDIKIDAFFNFLYNSRRPSAV